MTRFFLVGHYFACYFLKPPLSDLKYCVHSVYNELRFISCEPAIIVNADIAWFSILENFINCFYFFLCCFCLCNLLFCLVCRIYHLSSCSCWSLFSLLSSFVKELLFNDV